MPNHLCEMPSCRMPAPGAAGLPAGSHRTRLCASCRATVRGALLSLSALHEECAMVLTAGRQQSFRRVGTRSRGGSPGGIRLNERALQARSDVLGLLSSWAALVADELVGSPPERRVPALVAYLDSHLEALLAHRAAADFGQETVGLAAELRAVLDLSPVEHWDIGPCTAPGCGLVVRALTRTGSRPTVCCDAGHAVQPRRWLTLNRPPGGVGASTGPAAS